MTVATARKTLNGAPRPENPRPEKHAASALVIDGRVQRVIVQARVRKIAEALRPESIGVITVSHRIDGNLVVLDGQHRLAALRARGLTEHVVACTVYYGLSLRDEAELFLDLNDTRKASVLDKFVIGLIAEDPEATAIDAIVTKHGLEVGTNTRNGQIACVGAMTKLYRRGGVVTGSDALDSALSIVVDAWDATADALEGAIVGGIGELYLAHGTRIDRGSLVNKLRKYKGGPGVLLGSAKQMQYTRGTHAEKVRDVIAQHYDYGRRVRRLDQTA